MAHSISIKSMLGQCGIQSVACRLGRQFPDCSYAGVEGDNVRTFTRSGGAIAWLVDESDLPRLLIITPHNWRPSRRRPIADQLAEVRRGEIRPNGRIILDEPEAEH
jgi:hypothetical protein